LIEVMIVEDDAMVREINSKFLKRIEGFVLYKAVSNLDDEKKFISIKKPGLILLDVYFLKENGVDLLKWIRGQDIDIILIIADDLAEKLGIARVTVRRYLEYMEKENKVEKLVEYGKVGRPQHKYYKI